MTITFLLPLVSFVSLVLSFLIGHTLGSISEMRKHNSWLRKEIERITFQEKKIEEIKKMIGVREGPNG